MHTAQEHLYLGIEIGGTKLQLIAGSAAGTIVQQSRFAVNPDAGAAGILQQLETGIRQLLEQYSFKAVGVGFGGPVNRQEGTVAASHQIEGWKNFPLQHWLQQLTEAPAVLENDANTAALAEARQGSGKGFEHVFYCTLGSGIGGGLVVHGKIYHGRTPGEVEVGHLRLNKQGTTLEAACSGWAVNKKVRHFIEQHPESLLAKLSAHSTQPEATLLAAALQQGDAAALTITADVADDLAFAFSHVVHLFHPDVVVIGGGLSHLGQHLLAPLEAALPQYLMQAFQPPPPLRLAQLGENVVPIGALELARAAVTAQQNDYY